MSFTSCSPRLCCQKHEELYAYAFDAFIQNDRSHFLEVKPTHKLNIYSRDFLKEAERGGMGGTMLTGKSAMTPSGVPVSHNKSTSI